MPDIKTQLAGLKELQRQRFHEARKERANIVAKSAPLRAQLDGNLDNLTGAQERALRAQIIEAEKGLYELDCEIAEMARAHQGPDGKSRMGKSS